MPRISDPKSLAIVAANALADRDFSYLLQHVKVRGDDPKDPKPSPWQPWEYLQARASAWASGQSEVDLKARQLGYTWLLAAYLKWRGRQGWACAIISKGQLDSRSVIARVKFIDENLPPHLRSGAKFNVDSVEFPGGGSIIGLPSTPDAGVGQTLQLVAFDEFAFHPHGAANYSAISPTISAGGQMLIMSTADPELGPSGMFHDMYWDSKNGLTGYTAHFEPWFARPGRDSDWLKRERARFVGVADEFDAWFPDTDTAAFVGRSGLVFPMFSRERHVKTPTVPIEECRRVVAGVDFGGGDPTAVVILGMDKDQHVHQYAEFYKRGAVGVDEIGGFIRRFPVDSVVCDPSQGVAIETLKRSFNLPARAANNRREGINTVIFLFQNDRITIDPLCGDSIAEFPGYRWANKTDPNDHTKYATTTPVDHHADAMDARRYAVLEITAMLHSTHGSPVRTISGRRPKRKAA